MNVDLRDGAKYFMPNICIVKLEQTLKKDLVGHISETVLEFHIEGNMTYCIIKYAALSLSQLFTKAACYVIFISLQI